MLKEELELNKLLFKKQFDLIQLSSGIYFLKLETENFQKSIKITLAK